MRWRHTRRATKHVKNKIFYHIGQSFHSHCGSEWTQSFPDTKHNPPQCIKGWFKTRVLTALTTPLPCADWDLDSDDSWIKRHLIFTFPKGGPEGSSFCIHRGGVNSCHPAATPRDSGQEGRWFPSALDLERPRFCSLLPRAGPAGGHHPGPWDTGGSEAHGRRRLGTGAAGAGGEELLRRAWPLQIPAGSTLCPAWGST